MRAISVKISLALLIRMVMFTPIPTSELQVSDSGIDKGKDQTETLNATTAAADDVDMDYNIQEPKLNGQVLGKLVIKTLKNIGLN